MKAIVLGGLLLAFGAPLAEAQISSDGGPIQIDAERSDIFDKEGRVVYTGNVDVLQGDARLRADKLTIFFNNEEGSSGVGFGASIGRDIVRIVATGNVFYVTPTQKARGDQGEYLADNESIRLTGNVVVTTGDNVAEANCLLINPQQGRTTLGGCPGRATTVINREDALETTTPGQPRNGN